MQRTVPPIADMNTPNVRLWQRHDRCTLSALRSATSILHNVMPKVKTLTLFHSFALVCVQIFGNRCSYKNIWARAH